jgi:hypothetical protein
MIIYEKDQPIIALDLKLDSRVSVEEFAKRLHQNPGSFKVVNTLESWDKIMKILATLQMFKKL